jgi:hypothetical protein
MVMREIGLSASGFVGERGPLTSAEIRSSSALTGTQLARAAPTQRTRRRAPVAAA